MAQEQITPVGWHPLICEYVAALSDEDVRAIFAEFKTLGRNAALAHLAGKIAALQPDWLYPPQSLIGEELQRRISILGCDDE